MRIMSPPDLLANVIHWISAFLILFMILLGWSFDEQSMDTTPHLILYHSIGGLLVLLLSSMRIFSGRRYQVYERSHHRWNSVIKRFVQINIYILLISAPLSGLVALPMLETPITLMGNVNLQDFIPFTDSNYLCCIQNLHKWLVNTLVLHIFVHISAAIRHHFLIKNDERGKFRA